MSDIFEKAEKFVSDSAKAKGQLQFCRFFPLKSMTKVDLCKNLKIGKINEKLKNCVQSQFLTKCFIIFGFGHNFSFQHITWLKPWGVHKRLKGTHS